MIRITGYESGKSHSMSLPQPDPSLSIPWPGTTYYVSRYQVPRTMSLDYCHHNRLHMNIIAAEYQHIFLPEIFLNLTPNHVQLVNVLNMSNVFINYRTPRHLGDTFNNPNRLVKAIISTLRFVGRQINTSLNEWEIKSGIRLLPLN